MAKKPKKYFVVWKGRQTGIFESWTETEAQVAGFPGAQYKGFETRAAAAQAWQGQYADYAGKGVTPAGRQLWFAGSGGPLLPSMAVDAACSGNPGRLEYRGVETETGRELFRQGPFEHGTNNVGEFLAIVHALGRLKRQGSDWPIYSDSRNALKWVQEKRCRTELAPDEQNAELFRLIARAETWLQTHAYSNPLLKWDTERWGEIPADFGRK